MESLLSNFLKTFLLAVFTSFKQIFNQFWNVWVFVQDIFKFLVSLKQFMRTRKVLVKECVQIFDCILNPLIAFINFEIWLLLLVKEWHEIRLQTIDSICRLDYHRHTTQNKFSTLIDTRFVNDFLFVFLIFTSLDLFTIFFFAFSLGFLWFLTFLSIWLFNTEMNDDTWCVIHFP